MIKNISFDVCCQANHNEKRYQQISETLKTCLKKRLDHTPHAQQVRSKFSYNVCNISLYILVLIRNL